jgi:hypothetical protein
MPSFRAASTAVLPWESSTSASLSMVMIYSGVNAFFFMLPASLSLGPEYTSPSGPVGGQGNVELAHHPAFPAGLVSKSVLLAPSSPKTMPTKADQKNDDLFSGDLFHL